MNDRTRRSKTGGNSNLATFKDSHNDKYDSLENLKETGGRGSSRVEEHTKIFASMCPDEILDHYDDYSSRIYQTTLMLGDVSGFTELAEKYTYSGKGGPSKLTETLNSYIGAMVQEILSHDGDLLKFSGDAFIVMWKVREDTVMRDVAIEAIQTACVIQKHFGTYETDVGVTLKVKLAIASGKIYFTSIGDPRKTSYYIITGKPVWDVKYAEALCRGGDILVAPSSWQWANPNEYIYETLPDGVHTLILGSSLMWQQPKETYELAPDQNMARQSTLFRNYSTILPETSMQQGKSKSVDESRIFLQLTGISNVQDFEIKEVDYSLRPKVIKAGRKRLKNELRSYMLPPVVRFVELDEPIDYLTEMRQVVIVFVNVVTTNLGKKRLVLLVDAAYKLICGVVGEMEGCVNKTSLFDKDLMFLCIFGLRGEKHELESQIGLRCATKIRQILTRMNHVKSVTVGVTTGITYCGVVGHILRREYTVIGTTVNKAARLMCAYADKVICDRDSFLYSRLEARHFILQEPIHLKGISNVGPVYEFLEQAQFQGATLVPSQYPLLGRESEIKTFKTLLANTRDAWIAKKTGNIVSRTKNILIIRGEPRMGKSRLLDEITRITPSEISCNHITLVKNDYQVAYSLINLIFSVPLGSGTEVLTPKERENKLISYLGKIRRPHYLCALNQAFNVNFNASSRYRSLGDVEKRKLLRKFVGKLVHTCFRRPSVIVVDDAENTDPESLSLLATIVKHDRLLFVLSFGHKNFNEIKLDPLILENSQVMELAGIDKWFHAALACQILNVVAIPPELEKIIQQRSMGNPGWIESYLVSLTQAGGLVVKKTWMKNLRGMGFVIPPASMIQRSTLKADDGNFHVETETIPKRFDGWKMYRSSFCESESTLGEESEPGTSPSRDIKRVKIEDKKSVNVCTIARNFVLRDVDTEITMDVMILKLFDSLTPQNQFLLKCAAVVGETIDRNMLEKLMEGMTDREIAIAVATLFEIRIVGCASGDFVTSPGPLMFYRHTRKPNLDMEIGCGCTDVPVRESLSDLPKYATCGLMRFKMSVFRDTTYRLLTENQKVEFHTKALKYLRQNTRRCESCGGGQFGKLLGRVYPETMKAERKRFDNLDYILKLSDYGEAIVRDKQDKIEEISSDTENQRRSFMNFCRPVEKRSTRTFSNIDFSNCQCDLILNTVYSQMLDHCRAIERKDKTLTAILEFVEILLADLNVPQARKLLNEAEVILAEIFGTGRDDELVTLPYLTGKIKTLYGRCYLQSGLINEAARSLDGAITSLGWNFPRTGIMAECKSRFLFQEQRLMLTCLREWKVGIADGDAANYNDQLANCLAQMYIVFRTRGMCKHARLAATWGLNTALSSSKNFFALCTAYSNMINIAQNYKNKNIVPILENSAINMCNRRKDALELQDLRAVAELYSSIFFSRWLRGQIAGASSLGYVALRISRTVRSATLRLRILPRLVHLLLVACRHDEVVMLLRELDFISNNDMDKSGRTWYYALCVDFQLEAGVTVIPFKKCEQYYQEEGDTMINLRDPEAERRYFTSMWLWCVRMEEWEAATVWRSKKISADDKAEEETVAASITALKKLEGLLIYYAHKLDNRNAKAIETILVDIRKQFKLIDKLKTVKVILARSLLMKAYYNMVRYRTKAGMKLLQRSKKIALQMENRMIYEWADHCEKAWTGSLSILQKDLWKVRCDRVSRISWHDIDQNARKIIPYTLPLPAYPQNF